MGNQQSNERQRNYKIYKITNEDKHECYIRCHLNDYVDYRNGRHKYIDFERRTNDVVAIFEMSAAILGVKPLDREVLTSEGTYIAIDLNRTRDYESSHDFDKRDSVAITVGKERVDSDGNVSIMEIIGGIAQAISESRERHIAQVEQARFSRQINE